jgi:protein gp37
MTSIEWTHRPGTKGETLNTTTGCDKVSQGCKNCFAEVMHKRLRGMGQPKYQEPFLGHVKFWPDELAKPFKWKKPRTVFLNSMSDIFHKDIDVRQIAEIYAMMFLTQKHTYIVLTKRADRARVVLNSKEFWGHYVDAVNNLPYESEWSVKVWTRDELSSRWPLTNVWQGVSVENQHHIDRVEDLSATPAHIRVVSYEPVIGPLDLSAIFGLYQLEDGSWHLKVGSRWEGSPDWLIAGGESGHKARPYHPQWFRTVRDQCAAAGVPFFLKQFGEWGTTTCNMTTQEPTYKMYHSYQHFTQKDWVHKGQVCVDVNGKQCEIGKDFMEAEYPVVILSKVGKNNSGNTLDGVQHLNFPE